MKTINDYRIWENPEKIDIQIKGSEKLKEWKWLNSEAIHYEKNWESFNEDWKPYVWESVVRDVSNWVIAILPVTKDWNIILIEEVRIPIISDTCDGRTIWMPAWLVDEWDTKEYTVYKELAEETGYKTDDIEYVSSIYSSEWMTNEKVDIFIAFNCNKITEIIDWYKEVNWHIVKHEAWENISAIYSVPHKDIYNFLDTVESNWIAVGWKIDRALSKLERKFADRI